MPGREEGCGSRCGLGVQLRFGGMKSVLQTAAAMGTQRCGCVNPARLHSQGDLNGQPYVILPP